MKKHKNDFKEFIGKHYGTQTRMANSLGVTPETVRSWIVKNPRGILKHTPEIVKEKNITASQVVWEVMHHERYLQA
jgi:predicted transcriptional regulator|tara:strand:- start:3138 stop:3365 length:228 start_codon:yes stop_codon:yes gene_type:complete